jgi:Transglutaminase-like superfamily
MVVIKMILSSKTQGLATDRADYVLAPNVILLLLQDETARLLDLGGNFYAVTAIGAKMLQETFDRGTVGAVQSIAATYNIEARQVQADLDIFFQKLEKQRLIYRAGSHQPLSKPSITLPFLVLVPLLFFIHHCISSLKWRAWSLLTLARLSFRLFGWPATVAVWQRYHGKVSKHEAAQERELIQRIDELIRLVAAKHVFDMGCKERSLCCWALLRSAGLPATLVLGINLFPLASHCWCESDQWTLSDYEDRCERFTPVMRYQ